MTEIPIRPAEDIDAAAMAAVLTPIVLAGGTTAIATPMTPEEIIAAFIRSKGAVCCHVALDPDGVVAGFQTLYRADHLPEDVGDIASFTRRDPPLKGAGRALFAATVEAARGAGLAEINATIRADNVPGLGYYTKMGFQDHDRIKGVPLKDGTPVDRVQKRYAL